MSGFEKGRKLLGGMRAIHIPRPDKRSVGGLHRRLIFKSLQAGYLSLELQLARLLSEGTEAFGEQRQHYQVYLTGLESHYRSPIISHALLKILSQDDAVRQSHRFKSLYRAIGGSQCAGYLGRENSDPLKISPYNLLGESFTEDIGGNPMNKRIAAVGDDTGIRSTY